jgi:class 3 adenylate cyclase/CheY-like chemotaxis protein
MTSAEADPSGSAATADPYRAIRHDLRTPINHIVGYSELLLDEALDGGIEALTPDLRRIQAAGRELLAMVNDFFVPTRAGLAEDELRRMCHGLRTPLDAVIGYSDLLREEAADLGRESVVGDLARIRAAGEHMLRLVDAVLGLAGVGGSPDGAAEAVLARATDAGAALGPDTGTLLVVDDNALNRDVLTRRLERQGYTVVAVGDGAAALEALAGRAIDLVLLDVVMPDMDGYQVCRAIRAEPATAMLPVVMVTASDADEKTRAILAGADDLVPKPFDPTELLARVRSLLRIKRYQDRIAEQSAELAEWNRGLEERVKGQVEEIGRLGRLRRFLSPQLADLVVTSGDEGFLRPHRRQIACAFCDFRGFSAFCETAEPEEVTEVLATYHEEMGRLIREYGATVDHFAGDGLLVFFNDPVRCDAPAERAVRMAVAMRTRMEELTAGWRRSGYRLGFGIGLTFGYATIGQVGFEGRYDYSANGPVVNLSARLCGEAAEGQILITERVLAGVEELIVAEPLGELTLKGFHRPVAAYNVVGLRS